MLSLRIKKQYLDQIIAGTKTVEYRAFTDFYTSRLAIVENGMIADFQPHKKVKLYVGNTPDAPYAICEVEGIYLCKYINEIPEGFEKDDYAYEIHLGAIIEHS